MDPSRNMLDREISPYLLQHRDNPVHWQPWSPETLAMARAAGKPILLSVGYAACHWCHVMAHESFAQRQTAAVMNALFVNIKVDREERPDLDAIYQNALSSLGQPGGWPLTMFLTPDGRPFWGGTYFPPDARHGRPGFVDVLRTISDVYHRQPERVRHNVGQIEDTLCRMTEDAPGDLPGMALLARWAEACLDLIDTDRGGTRGAPKFPQPSLFAMLWRAGLRCDHPGLKDAVLLTLNHLCQGGIYDHLGGGFARYATDAAWRVPSFA